MIDVGFHKFITLRIISIFWIMAIALTVLTYISLVIGVGFSDNASIGQWLGVIFLAPIFGACWLLFVRIWLELVAVIFRIAENTRPVRSAESIQFMPADQRQGPFA